MTFEAAMQLMRTGATVRHGLARVTIRDNRMCIFDDHCGWIIMGPGDKIDIGLVMSSNWHLEKKDGGLHGD